MGAMDKRIENTNLNVSLPKTLKAYVRERAADSGCGTASEYVRRLIQEDRRVRAREALEEKLLAGLIGEDVEMGSVDWAEIRHEVAESVRRRARSKKY